MYSYHIFYFPFKWDVLSKDVSSSFSERIDLDSICFNEYSPWERVFDNQKETDYLLYNEKNYFYSFVHPVLYDTGKKGTVMQHFERKEVRRGNVRYNIQIKGKETYSLVVEDIVLNLYSTGVGILVFYLRNDSYTDPMDVLKINQFGRRIFPPFLGQNNSLDAPQNDELAEALYITGLDGTLTRYREDFTWYNRPDKAWDPAKFIQSLVLDLSPNFVMIPYEAKRDLTSLEPEKLRKGIVPAVDDRMFVASVIFDKKMSEKISPKDEGEGPLESDWYLSEGDLPEKEKYFWLRYVYVDVDATCIGNSGMRKRLAEQCTYLRWQEKGTLYGYSRYSFVCVTGVTSFSSILHNQFRTMYSRMLELVLVQRASILKFSGEVTRLSNLREQDPHLLESIRNLYREYIRFVNQIYFREVTAQEQGIELYQALQIQIGLKEQVESLDAEIGELHEYARLLEDRNQNSQLNLITKIGGVFLIPSLLVGYFGMNIFNQKERIFLIEMFIVGLVVMVSVFYYLFFVCKHKYRKILAWVLVVLILLGMLGLSYYMGK